MHGHLSLQKRCTVNKVINFKYVLKEKQNAMLMGFFLTSWSWKRKIKKIFGKEILWEDQPCQVIVEFLIVRQKCRTWEVNKDIWHEDDF